MKATQNGILFNFPIELKDELQNFLTAYQPISFDCALNESGLDIQMPEGDKKCRYCKNPTATFNTVSHTIPEFLGNAGSVSNFECDTCNKLFSKLELQLSNFLGPFVTLNRIKGKKKIPNAPSSDKKIIARKIDFFGAKSAIEFGSTDNSPEKIKHNKEDGSYTVEFETQPFVPYDVYKSFLKMAMGLLHEQDCEDFNECFKLLQDVRNKKYKPHPLLGVYTSSLRIPYNYTGIILFKRKEKNKVVPPLSFVLFFRQFMFQIFIPFQTPYLNSVKGRTISFPRLPPILPNPEIAQLDFHSEFTDLNGITSKSRNMLVHLKFNSKNVTKIGIDLNRKEVVDHVLDPKKVVQFIITTDDFSFELPQSDK